jgi:ubiquinone biosynthesis accessory factor UbiK
MSASNSTSTPGFGSLPQPPAALLDVHRRIMDLLRSSPAGDIERNVKAVIQQGFQRMDLVTREDYEIQAAMLSALQSRVKALEDKLAKLESPSSKP